MYQLPTAPTPQYDPIYKKGKPLSFGRTVTQETGMSSGGVSNLIDYIMKDAQANREATLKARQGAIDTLVNREQGDMKPYKDYSSSISAEIQRRTGGGNDPFVSNLKNNLSSVINNPNVYNDQQFNQFADAAETKANNKLGQLESSFRQSSPYGAGGRNVNLANQYAQASGEANMGVMDLRREMAKLSSDRQMGALDISSRLKSDEENALNQLFGFNTNIGLAEGNANQTRSQAISDLLGGTVYNPADLSGLLNLLVNARAGMKAGKKGKTNSLIGAGGSIGGAALGGLLGNTNLFGP